MRNTLALLAVLVASPAVSQVPLPHFVRANATHTLYHELAHALIDQFSIPVLGQEEDAADNFATLEIARRFEGDAKPMLADVAAAWLMLDADLDRDDLDYQGPHDLDAQRAYRAVCMYFGLAPSKRRDIADWADIPRDLRDVCTETALMTRDSWERAISDTIRSDSSPRPDVTLTFNAPGRNNVARQRLERSGILQDFVADIRDSFAWPNPISVTALTCDQPNAFWDPETRTIEMCYEIIDEWIIQSLRDNRTPEERFRAPSARDIAPLKPLPEKNVRN